MKKPSSICVFGDSTSWGAWDLEKGGWVSRLWMDIGIRDDDYVELNNCSISGGTTEMLLKRFESEAVARGADALIFQTGGNDAAHNSAGMCQVSQEKFQQNLVEIIGRAKKITNRIVFVDLKNCDESRTTPVSWVDSYYTNENIERYSKVMQEVCEKEGVFFIDMPYLENEDFEDGLHPNTSGHEKIFRKIKSFLEEKEWI